MVVLPVPPPLSFTLTLLRDLQVPATSSQALQSETEALVLLFSIYGSDLKFFRAELTVLMRTAFPLATVTDGPCSPSRGCLGVRRLGAFKGNSGLELFFKAK